MKNPKLLHKVQQARRQHPNAAKRGDTIIEVMFAVAVFALIAVLSISMMNSGVAVAERALETVVARNEINAQVEALRYIHSSYIIEKTLPICSDLYNTVNAGQKCQQFQDLWSQITNNAIPASTYASEMSEPLTNCNTMYADNNKKLDDLNAFVINTRILRHANHDGTITGTFRPYVGIEATDSGQPIFHPATLGARIIFVNNSDYSVGGGTTSEEAMQTTNPAYYDRVGRVDGLWVVAVKERNNNPRYYDFYVGTCWYGSGSNAPTTLDTVIRLYNPEGANFDYQ